MSQPWFLLLKMLRTLDGPSRDGRAKNCVTQINFLSHESAAYFLSVPIGNTSLTHFVDIGHGRHYSQQLGQK